MTTEPDGEVSVPVRIGDQDVRLLVDTGSVIGSLSYETAWAKQLKSFPIEGARFEFAAKVRIKEYTLVSNTMVGRAPLGEQAFLLVPDDMLDSDTDGILAPSILANFDVDLDFAKGKLNLFLHDHCPGRVVYWTRGGYASVPMKISRDLKIKVPVTLDGQSLTAIIDTGSERSSINSSTAGSSFGVDERSPGIKNLGKIMINGTQGIQAYRYPFRHLSFGGVAVNNPDLMILPDEDLAHIGGDILVGISILRQLHLYIAYKEQMLYVTPAQPVEPPPMPPPLPPSP
jgi:predicted aspartyl protease